MLLFVSHDGGRTGAPMVLLHFLKWLRANTRHDFNVLIRTDGPMVEPFRQLADTHVIEGYGGFGGGRLRRVLRRIRRRASRRHHWALPAEWEGRRWDLLYSNTATNGTLVDGLGDRAGSVLTHVHEMQYWIERNGKENWECVRRHSSRFIAASGAVRSTLVEGYGVPSELVEVVHEFIAEISPRKREDSLAVRKELGLPKSAFVVGGSGQEFWRKGRDLFVQLAAMARRGAPERDIRFVWVGRKDDNELQRGLEYDAAMAGVQDRIHWTGEVSNAARFFGVFDAFAMVSREDPFPLVCLEAGLLELPILCFADAGGIPELVGEDAGFVVPYLDLQTMTARILQLSVNADLCHKLGACARHKVMERYTVKYAGPRILRLIEDQLARTT